MIFLNFRTTLVVRCSRVKSRRSWSMSYRQWFYSIRRYLKFLVVSWCFEFYPPSFKEWLQFRTHNFWSLNEQHSLCPDEREITILEILFQPSTQFYFGNRRVRLWRTRSYELSWARDLWICKLRGIYNVSIHHKHAIECLGTRIVRIREHPRQGYTQMTEKVFARFALPCFYCVVFFCSLSKLIISGERRYCQPYQQFIFFGCIYCFCCGYQRSMQPNPEVPVCLWENVREIHTHVCLWLVLFNKLWLLRRCNQLPLVAISPAFANKIGNSSCHGNYCPRLPPL